MHNFRSLWESHKTKVDKALSDCDLVFCWHLKCEGHNMTRWTVICACYPGKCINNRTKGRYRKGAKLIVYYSRKRHLWGSTLHAGNFIPLRFYLGWSAFWGRCKRNSCLALLVIILYDRGGFLGGALEWFQRSYIIVMPCLWLNLEVYLNTPAIVCIRIYRQIIYNGWSNDIHVRWMVLIKTIYYQGRF